MHSEQRLVGRHHMLAVVDRAQYEFTGDASAADHLRNDVQRRIIDHSGKIRRQRHRVERIAQHLLRLGRIAHRDARDFDPAAGPAADFFLVAAQHVERAAADRATAQQSYFDRFYHPACVMVIEKGRNARGAPHALVRLR